MSAAAAAAKHKDPGGRALTSSGLSHGKVIVIFVGLLLGILMSALDQTIVSTALPTIASDLNGLQEISWIITTYLLAQTIVMPIYGKVGDIIGRKLSFQIAIVIFLAGSVLAGIAQSMEMLIAFRAVQGIGAGGLMIGAQTIIAEIVTPRERGKYMSVMGPMIGVATVLGPLLGGYLTEAVSWRWIFYINVPIGIGAMIVTGVVLKLPMQRRRPQVDYLGAMFMAGAVACLVLLLSWGGRRYGWLSPTIIGLAVGVLVLTPLFLWAERRAAEPVLPLRLFHDDVFRINAPLAFLIGIAMFGAVSYLPTFLQLSLGASATLSGVLLLPLMGGLMLAAVITGQLITRTGRYKIFPIIGAAFATVGMYLLSLMDADTSRTMSSLYMVVLGLGIGFIMPTLVLTVQNSVRREDMSTATAGINFFRQIGASFGTAVIGSLFVGRLATDLSARLPHSFTAKLGGHAEGVTHSQLQKFPPKIAHDFVISYAHALTPLYVYLVPIIAVGFVLAFFLKEKPLATAFARGSAANREPDGVASPTAVDTDTNTVGAGAGRRAEAEPSLSGSVRRADQPVAAATLTLTSADGTDVGGTRTAFDGSYRLITPGAGTYLLHTVDEAGRPEVAEVVIDGRPVIHNVQLTR
jgi:EmrB/QacA subfamily drug resistance transporter